MKNFKLIILGLILIFGMITFVYAEDLNFEIGEPLDIKVYCMDVNNTFCGAGTSCNLSAFSPNNTLLTSSQEMTRTGDYFNYTIKNTANTPGQYVVVSNCINGDSKGYVSFNFILGSHYSDAQSGLISTILYIVFGLSVFFLVISKFTDKVGMQLFFVIASFISLIATMMLGVVSIQSMLTSNKILNSTSYVLYALGFIFFAFMCIMMINFIKQGVDALKSNRGLQ